MVVEGVRKSWVKWFKDNRWLVIVGAPIAAAIVGRLLGWVFGWW